LSSIRTKDSLNRNKKYLVQELTNFWITERKPLPSKKGYCDLLLWKETERDNSEYPANIWSFAGVIDTL